MLITTLITKKLLRLRIILLSKDATCRHAAQGDVVGYSHLNPGLDEERAVRLILEPFLADVAVLHTQGLVQRNIKRESIRALHIKIADSGLSIDSSCECDSTRWVGVGVGVPPMLHASMSSSSRPRWAGPWTLPACPSLPACYCLPASPCLLLPAHPCLPAGPWTLEPACLPICYCLLLPAHPCLPAGPWTLDPACLPIPACLLLPATACYCLLLPAYRLPACYCLPATACLVVMHHTSVSATACLSATACHPGWARLTTWPPKSCTAQGHSTPVARH